MTNEIRIYVADLAAYNNGKLHGVWIDATQELNDIEEAVNAMLANSPEEDAEEYAIHDYEGFSPVSISEYEGLESVHDKAVFIEEYDELGAYVLDYCCEDIEDARRAMEESYAGEYTSVADFVQELTEDAVANIPENLSFYIDYERMGRDMELSGDIYTVETGFNQVHIFWSH